MLSALWAGYSVVEPVWGMDGGWYIEDAALLHPLSFFDPQTGAAGIKLDVAQGRPHVGFTVARTAFAAGIFPDTISSDVVTFSVHGIVKDLPNVMSKFLALGLSGLLAIGVIGGASAAMNEPGDGPNAGASASERRIDRPVLATIKSIMKTCDISRVELRDGYQAGQSINQILEAKAGLRRKMNPVQGFRSLRASLKDERKIRR